MLQDEIVEEIYWIREE